MRRQLARGGGRLATWWAPFEADAGSDAHRGDGGSKFGFRCLITGETGSVVAADDFTNLSPRATGPFCAYPKLFSDSRNGSWKAKFRTTSAVRLRGAGRNAASVLRAVRRRDAAASMRSDEHCPPADASETPCACWKTAKVGPPAEEARRDARGCARLAAHKQRSRKSGRRGHLRQDLYFRTE